MNKGSKRFIIILCVLIVFCIASISFSAKEGSLLGRVYNVIGTPFQYIQKGFTAVGTSVRKAFSVMTEYSEIKDRIEELQKENDRLQNMENEINKLEDENATLRELLELKGYFENYEMVAANVIAQDVSDWFNEFTIDKGTNDGISNGDVVITADGLVGVVYNCSAGAAKVRSIVDEQYILYGRISRSNELVRLRGTSNENYSALLKLDRIADSTDLYIGDEIVTAESGGVYPKGLVLGVVVDIVIDTDSGERYAYVAPAVNFTTVSQLFVLVDNTQEAD